MWLGIVKTSFPLDGVNVAAVGVNLVLANTLPAIQATVSFLTNSKFASRSATAFGE